MERPFRNSNSLILVALILTCGPSMAEATTVSAWWRNREGIKKLEQKSNGQAYQIFLKALESDPLNPDLHMNLAYTFQANEEYEKAESAYRGALKVIPENSPHRFAANFNLGVVLAQEKKIEEALDAYQVALDLVPDSKEVKTNIELLWKGGGGGGGKDKKDDKKDQKGDNKDQKNDNDGKDKQYQDPRDKKNEPKPFNSQDLTPQDVKKILDEIKNQEQSIRAGEYERNMKDAPKGKDW